MVQFFVFLFLPLAFRTFFLSAAFLHYKQLLASLCATSGSSIQLNFKRLGRIQSNPYNGDSHGLEFGRVTPGKVLFAFNALMLFFSFFCAPFYRQIVTSIYTKFSLVTQYLNLVHVIWVGRLLKGQKCGCHAYILSWLRETNDVRGTKHVIQELSLTHIEKNFKISFLELLYKR